MIAAVLAPRVASFLIAGIIALALADSVYRIPIQVSDSVEPILIAARAPSAAALFKETLTSSRTTLRPMRYVQARWLMSVASITGRTHHEVFRGFHALLIAALVLVFVVACGIDSWTDVAAIALPLTVLTGLHTFTGTVREAYPVNHYAEVALAALAVLAVARRQPRWWHGAIVVLMLVFVLLLLESGILVWAAIALCVAAGLPGLSRRVLIAATIVLVAYGWGRYQLGMEQPSIGGHGSGFGDTFYSGSDLQERFRDHPLLFEAYNVAGGLSSVLLSEPRVGVYETLRAWRSGTVRPVLPINLFSSLAVTAGIVWYATRRLPRRRSQWSDRDRMFVVAVLLVLLNALFAAPYIKDEILSVGGVYYAVAAFVVMRAVVESASAANWRILVPAAGALLLCGGLWAFRAAGVHFQLRHTAFYTRNDWVDALEPSRIQQHTPDERSLIRRIGDEAIGRRTASPSFLPDWGESAWME